MAPKIQTAERTLQAHQKRRSTPACYPCFKRKVKCRGGRPCEACNERGHPEICYVEELSKGSRRHPKGKIQAAPKTQETSEEPVGNEPNTGELSVINFVKDNLGALEGKNDTLHAMGISNSVFPLSLTTFGKTTNDTKDSLPLRADILQYYPPFRDFVMPIYPVIPDPLSLETSIAELLQGTPTLVEPGKLAVVLSCLALGAQFTEAQVDNRWQVSQDFIVQASAYLQRANCIFEPSTEVIQALLMIGIGLQNLGLSNGAWNLLGLTYRCAQSLGLHRCTDDSEIGYQGTMLWTAIIWQDALMSLRYDRTPLTPKEREDDPAAHLGSSLEPYYDTISRFCRVTLNMLHQPKSWRHNPQNVSSKIEHLENLVATARDHLNPGYTNRTLQQKFQYHAVRFHSSMLIAELCRPCFSIIEAENDNAHKIIRQQGVHYLSVVVESFLDLCTISNIPLRLWSLTQAGVSCALVLALIDSKHPLPKAQGLLRRLVDILRMDGASGMTDQAQLKTKTSEPYRMYRKSATLLESILSRTKNSSTENSVELTASTTVPSVRPDTLIDENPFDLTFNEFLDWPTELSFFDFSDSMLQANLQEDIYDT